MIQNLTEPFPIGTPVKIRNSGYGRATIVELRGPHGERLPPLLGALLRSTPLRCAPGRSTAQGPQQRG